MLMSTRQETLRAELLSLTPSQERAIDVLVNGGTQAAAAQAGDVTRETVCRWACHHPAFQAALNSARRLLGDEQLDAQRRIRGLALSRIEQLLPTADLASVLAVLRAMADPTPADTVMPTLAGEILDNRTHRTRRGATPALPVRSHDGSIDHLASFNAPNEDERAARITIERLAEAVGLERPADARTR